MAPKTPQRHLESMQLILQVWLYIKPEQHAPVSCHMASFLQRLLKAPWTATPSSSTTVELESEDEKNIKYATMAHLELAKVDGLSLDEGDVFSRVDIDLRITQRTVSPEKRAEAFSNILQRISMEFKRHSFSPFTGLDSESKRIIAWELRGRTSAQGSFKQKKTEKNQAAWVLPAPAKKGTERPAGKIEAELYKLVSIKQRRPDADFLKPVEGHDALKRLENRLYSQKVLYEQLKEKQKILEDGHPEEGSIRQHIDEYVEILERLDEDLSEVIAIYDHSIGRRNFSADLIGQRERSGFAALRLRLLRSIGIHKYGTIKINDKYFEELKDRARQELRHMQRMAPLLAAHVRLQQSETGQKLKQTCDLASEGPEKSEFTSKMAIQPANLSNRKAQLAILAHVSKGYEKTRENLLVQVEALDRFLAKKVTEKGFEIFRKRLTFKSLMSQLFPPDEFIQNLPHYYTYGTYEHCAKLCAGLSFYHDMGWCGKIWDNKEAGEKIYSGKESCAEASLCPCCSFSSLDGQASLDGQD
ncbi:hypothetical protein V8F06_000551 [Rhypophila decipiens]